ncbi:MAG: hypothetical protein JNM07_13200 [Phycisphaerae bacterium]|nr:hypothetical protein [Phycisphaerae bacterium]
MIPDSTTSALDLSPTESALLEAVLTPDPASLSDIARRLNLTRLEVLTTFSSPAFRAAVDLTLEFEALRRAVRFSPSAFATLGRALDTNAAPAESRRIAAAMLRAVGPTTRLLRARPRISPPRAAAPPSIPALAPTAVPAPSPRADLRAPVPTAPPAPRHRAAALTPSPRDRAATADADSFVFDPPQVAPPRHPPRSSPAGLAARAGWPGPAP